MHTPTNTILHAQVNTHTPKQILSKLNEHYILIIYIYLMNIVAASIFF